METCLEKALIKGVVKVSVKEEIERKVRVICFFANRQKKKLNCCWKWLKNSGSQEQNCARLPIDPPKLKK